MLSKKSLEFFLDIFNVFYSRLFSVEKAIGGWRLIIVSSPSNYLVPFRVQDGDNGLSNFIIQEVRLDIKDFCFQIPIHKSSLWME